MTTKLEVNSHLEWGTLADEDVLEKITHPGERKTITLAATRGDIERLTRGMLSPAGTLRHLVDDHRVRSKSGNPVLRRFGFPLHEACLMEEFHRLGVVIRSYPWEEYAAELVKDLKILMEAQGDARDAVISIRTLKEAEKRRLCSGKWREEVSDIFPDYERVTVNLSRDTTENPLESYFADYDRNLREAAAGKQLGFMHQDRLRVWEQYLVKTGRVRSLIRFKASWAAEIGRVWIGTAIRKIMIK